MVSCWRAIMKAADGPKSVSQAPLDCKVAFCTNLGGTSATPVAPVDEDLDGRLLAEATADHRKGGLDTFQLARGRPMPAVQSDQNTSRPRSRTPSRRHRKGPIPNQHSGVQNKTRRCFFPWIPLQGHLVTTIEEFLHVNRIETLGGFIGEIRRNVSQVEVVSVTLT